MKINSYSSNKVSTKATAKRNDGESGKKKWINNATDEWVTKLLKRFITWNCAREMTCENWRQMLSQQRRLREDCDQDFIVSFWIISQKCRYFFFFFCSFWFCALCRPISRSKYECGFVAHCTVHMFIVRLSQRKDDSRRRLRFAPYKWTMEFVKYVIGTRVSSRARTPWFMKNAINALKKKWSSKNDRRNKQNQTIDCT